MSDTESFDSVMAEMRKVVVDCDMERCDMYDGDCYKCQGDILYRMQRAHERELEHVRKAEFARGYHDGRCSMDAEHYAVALRLRGLRFDGGSHGNLSRIAYAIYPCATGWTCESSEGLRDRLIDLLGGVHEPDVALPTYDVLGNERHKAVCELQKLDGCSPLAHGFRDALAAAIDVPRDGAPYDDKELCHLICDRLIHLLGGDEPTAMEYIQHIVREHDRKYVGAELSQASVDAMSRRADQSHESSPMSLENETGITDEPDSQKSPILADSDGEDGGKVTITDELRKFKGHINAGLTPEMVLALRAQINWIADRIDEQFARCCELWERTATDTAQEIHDSMEAECNKLMEQQFELQQSLREVAECLKLPNAHELHGYKIDAVTKLIIGAINKLVDECDRLTEALDELQADPLGDVLVRVENERDELRRQMDQQRAMLTEQRDEARAKVLKVESENAEWRRGAERDADKLESLTGAYNDAVAECNELQTKLEEANRAIANYRERMKSLGESERLREKLQDELKELQDKLKELEKFEPDIAMAAYGDDNDELRRLLYRAAKLLANAEQDRDANYAHWMDCKEKVVHANVTIDELQAKNHDCNVMLDAIREAVDAVR